MLCGILPWTWFSASLTEASNSLIAGGDLIKKVLFPAEVLPIVSVLANMMHFFLALPIVAGVLMAYRHWPDPSGLIWFPVVVLVQLVFTVGIALPLAALTVHFRDIRDILANVLMLWFFSTPIIYAWFQPEVLPYRGLFNLNPFTHLGDFLSGDPVLLRTVRSLALAGGARRRIDWRLSRRLLALRSPARFLCGGGVTPAIGSMT